MTHPSSGEAVAKPSPGGLGRVLDQRVLLSIAVLALLPWLLPSKALAVNVLIYGVVVMGYNLLFGYTGLLSFGQAAFFGAGAYFTGIAIGRYGVPWFAAVPAAVLLSTCLAAAIGLVSTRTRGIYFIMVTLAFGEMLFFLFHDSKFAGGSDGAFIYNKPSMMLGNITLLDLEKPLVYYFVVLAVLVAVIALLTMIVRSPFGHALAAARDNERRARALGFPVFRVRLTAFVISGAIAGIAGYFAAAQFGFVAADQCRHENLKIAVDLGQRRKPLLPVDHKALGTVAHVDRQTGNSAIHMLDLDPRNEGNDDRVGKHRIRLLEIVADLADVRRDLRALEAAEFALGIAADAVDRRKAQDVGRARGKAEDDMLMALLRTDGVEDHRVG